MRWTCLVILISLMIAWPAMAFEQEDQSLSDRGYNFLLTQEGTRYSMYEDIAGHCTIGVGYLVHTGPCKRDGSDPREQEFLNGISEEKVRELLQIKVTECEEAVNRIVTVPINQNQFDALVSFTYNLGEDRLKQIAVNLNNGNYEGVPQEISLYHHADGVDSNGLIRRRSEEGELFLEGNLFQERGTIPIPSGPAADALKDQGNYDDYLINVLQATEKRIKQDPQDGDAWHSKSLALKALNYNAEAEDALSKARGAWNAKGNIFSSQGDYEEAVNAYEEVIRLDPNDAIAWNAKGVAFANLGNYAEAIESFDEAIRLNPNYAEAWNNKGKTLNSQGNSYLAIQCFNKAKALAQQEERGISSIYQNPNQLSRSEITDYPDIWDSNRLWNSKWIAKGSGKVGRPSAGNQESSKSQKNTQGMSEDEIRQEAKRRINEWFAAGAPGLN